MIAWVCRLPLTPSVPQPAPYWATLFWRWLYSCSKRHGPNWVSAAHADIVAAIELHRYRTQAVDCVSLIGAPGPPTLNADIIILRPSVRDVQSRGNYEGGAGHQ